MGKNIFLIILAFVVVLTAAASIYMMIESNAVHSFMVRDYDRYMHDFAQNEYFIAVRVDRLGVGKKAAPCHIGLSDQ